VILRCERLGAVLAELEARIAALHARIRAGLAVTLCLARLCQVEDGCGHAHGWGLGNDGRALLLWSLFGRHGRIPHQG
jgi:hypothetical protein